MFKKYNSIENAYRTKFLEKIQWHGFWDVPYVVQEKVHGANLSYCTTDGLNFSAAKRMGMIPTDEAFHNYEVILEAIKPQLIQIWRTLKNRYNDMRQMTIFGELIGGQYPHPDVAKDAKAQMVQKGIYYSPSNHFYAFDILLNQEKYLDVDEVNALFEANDLLYAHTLFEGSIEECLKYPDEFDSLVPKTLGLPELSPNKCEGVIIRPLKTAHFNNGSRIILKNKNEKWSENKKFHKIIKEDEPLSEQVLKLQEAILTYVTVNRLNNVLSKIGPVAVDKSDLSKVIGLFTKDILMDFGKDYGSILKPLEKKEKKAITKTVAGVAAKLVRAELEYV